MEIVPLQTENDRATEENSFNVKLLVSKILGHWFVFLLSLVFCVAAAFLLIRYSSPMYKISSMVTVDDDSNNPADKLQSATSSSIDFSDMFDLPSNAYNEMDNLRSPNLMTKTVKKLNLNIQVFRKGRIKRDELYDEAPFTVDMIEKTDSIRERSYN